MKQATVDLHNQTLTIDGETSTLVEAGLHINTDDNGYQYDRDDIIDTLNERYDGDIEVQFVGTEYRNFSASVEIADLEKLGWDFDIDQDDTTTREQWHAVVCVEGSGRTTYYLQQLRQYGNNTADGGWTGDDAATIENLVSLREAGKLWDIDEEYQLR